MAWNKLRTVSSASSSESLPAEQAPIVNDSPASMMSVTPGPAAWTTESFVIAHTDTNQEELANWSENASPEWMQKLEACSSDV